VTTKGFVCVFITTVPITKLFVFAWGEGDSGGHVGTREEPGTLTQGVTVCCLLLNTIRLFSPGSSRLGSDPKLHPLPPLMDRSS
jgi:hypothetical protein